MRKANINETTLGKRAGISPRTVGNFLRPEKREVSASGKVPSGKLTELEMIAKALYAANGAKFCLHCSQSFAIVALPQHSRCEWSQDERPA